MFLGSNARSESDDAQPQTLSTLASLGKKLLGVAAFSIIAGTILAETTTDHRTGQAKYVWAPSSKDRERMERAAAAALDGDIATGSIRGVKLDPCGTQASRKR